MDDFLYASKDNSPPSLIEREFEQSLQRAHERREVEMRARVRRRRRLMWVKFWLLVVVLTVPLAAILITLKYVVIH